jgi:GntR family transcriptional regulator
VVARALSFINPTVDQSTVRCCFDILTHCTNCTNIIGTVLLIEIQDELIIPIYRQVVDQVREQIASGALKPGDKLPSVRELARFLDINFNTVQKSYRELKGLGLVTIRPARGAIVSHRADEVLGSRRNELLLKKAVTDLLAEAHRLGFDKQQVLRVLQSPDLEDPQ